MNEVRWGIIGVGAVTEVKSGPAFQKANNSRLVAVMRRDKAKAEDYAHRHYISKWYDKAEDLINDPEVDAVYIATPPRYHKEYTLLAAKAHKPVYVEKPMALNFHECLEMIEACEKEEVPLFVAFYRRALPRFIKIKEILDSKIIGDIRFVSSFQYRKPSKEDYNQDNLPWRVIPEISGGGYFHDVGCHTLDIISYLVAPIKEVAGFSSNMGKLYPADDTVTITYILENGVQGTGTWCFVSSEEKEINEIIGEKGKITFSTFGSEPIILTVDGIDTLIPIPNPPHIQQPLIQTIVDELLGIGKCPSTGKTAIQTNLIMDLVTKRNK